MKIKHFFILSITLLSLISFSCKKDNDTTEDQQEPQDLLVKDLNNGTFIIGEPNSNAIPIYFSLSQQKKVTIQEDWDIVFAGPANTQITSNSKNEVWLDVKNLEYEKVTSKPSLAFNSNQTGNFANNENGWYRYDMNRHIVEPVKGRTIFIKNKQGIVYKLKMISIYLGAPEFPSPDDQATYLTFKYARLN